MPFTPSHAVVALPFVRTPLVPAAIAVGAMTPDLPLFVRGVPLPVLHYGHTHDPRWLPATVTVALVLLLLWRIVLRPTANELVPQFLAARLPVTWDAGATASLRETFARRGRGEASLSGALLLVASLALGVVSHIVWDLFTHEGRGGVLLLPALSEAWGPLPGYRWLQYGSSAIGLAILGIWAFVWLARRSPEPRPRRTSTTVRVMWLVSLPLVLFAAWLIGLAVYGPIGAEIPASYVAYRVLPPAAGVWAAGTVALAIAVRPRAAQQP